jgi:hypothetical protein
LCLLQAATRAKELLDGLRRGPRLFVAARRGPGDFLGEMEALSECCSSSFVVLHDVKGYCKALVQEWLS